MDELFAALPPLPTTLEIGSEQLDITPLKVGELPAFARAIRPIAQKLTHDPDWLALLADDGEAVLAALSLACRRPREWIDTLAVDDAVRLATAVFEANADFFIRRVAPEVTRVSGRIEALTRTPMPSSGSSATATATRTS